MSLGEIEEQLKETREELSRVSEEKEELAQRCHQLDSQVRMLMPLFCAKYFMTSSVCCV